MSHLHLVSHTFASHHTPSIHITCSTLHSPTDSNRLQHVSHCYNFSYFVLFTYVFSLFLEVSHGAAALTHFSLTHIAATILTHSTAVVLTHSIAILKHCHIGLCWSLPESARIYWSPPEFAGIHWSPQESAEIHWSPSEFGGIHWSPSESAGIHWSPLESTGPSNTICR